MTTPRVCTRCVMDTSDPEITFDAHGVCNHCHAYDEAIRAHVLHGAAGRAHLAEVAATIRAEGAGRPYDCIIGVSGGVDSTYVALQVKELGLRPLAVHLDNGWDSELAVSNIQEALNRLGIDLHTHVIDWEQFRNLQIAFLRASTPDSEIPSDHAIVSMLHQMADKVGVRWIISGVNRKTESHLPRAWSQGHMDWRYIKAVHRRFGSGKLDTFPHMTYLQQTSAMRRHRWFDILNYIDYVKADAVKVLEDRLGWRDYGGKHFESIYTRFYQGYILPTKFGYDKRKTHLSSLVCSGEVTRDEALARLKEDPYPPAMQREDLQYVRDKFGLSAQEFEDIMRLPPRSFWDYPSYARFYRGRLYRGLRAAYRLLRTRRPLIEPARA